MRCQTCWGARRLSGTRRRSCAKLSPASMAQDDQNPKVSRERLNQIATRKLGQLGIPVRAAADPQLLEGELPLSPGRVQHPGTGAALTRARFLVWGHDHLRFL